MVSKSSAFDPPDKASLKLSKQEKAALAALNVEIEVILRKRKELFRASAKRQGIIAKQLAELKSESGQSFVEEEKVRQTFSGRAYQKAVVKEKTSLGPYISEVAYLCRNPYVGEEKDSCGWVKGSPVAQDYNNISFLSGSAGVKYFCKICGQLIGEEIHIQS